MLEIDAATSAAILAGFDYAVDNEPYHFSYDDFDQQNFTDSAMVASLVQNGTAGLPQSVNWNAYKSEGRELVRLTFTATDFLTLYAAALAHKATQMEIGGQRKAAVETATTVEEVEAI